MGIIDERAMGKIVLQWISLGPTTQWILTFQHERDGLVQCRFNFWIPFDQIRAQQKLRSTGGVLPIKSCIAIIMVVLLKPPGITANGTVPLPHRPIAGEVDKIMPSARLMLSPNKRVYRLFRSFVIIFIPGRFV